MGIFGNGDRNGNNEKNPALNWYFYRVLKRYEWPFVEIGVGDTLNSISLLVVADALSLIRLQAQLNYTKDEEWKKRKKKILVFTRTNKFQRMIFQKCLGERKIKIYIYKYNINFFYPLIH